MSKRHLGLGKSKAKKQKTESKVDDSTPSNELTVELSHEADADDELAQLEALWKTYSESEKKNELVVNGTVHECDRLLRASKSDDIDKVKLTGAFYAIYALALGELAKFNGEDHTKVVEFFDAAIERANLGLEEHPDSVDVLFAKSKILMDRIPLQFISQLDLESQIGEQIPEISKLLDEALSLYEKAENKNEDRTFNENNFEILETLDDLLDMCDKFGEDEEEEDEEDEEDEDKESIEVPESHPLYSVRHTHSYVKWWRDHTEKFLDNVSAQMKVTEGNDVNKLHGKVCERLAKSYLKEAEKPLNVFMALAYDDDLQDTKELLGFTKENAHKVAKELMEKALGFLNMTENDDPEFMATTAEATISLGNLMDVDSKEQEELYKTAEKLLTKANNLTNGKYQDILDNLLSEE